MVDDLLGAYAHYLHRLVLISDDVRTRDLLPDESGNGHKNPPFRLAALRREWAAGRLIVRPLEALNESQLGAHFECKSCQSGHSPMAVHYFDHDLRLDEAPPLELTPTQEDAYRREAAENECCELEFYSKNMQVTQAGMLRIGFFARVDALQWEHNDFMQQVYSRLSIALDKRHIGQVRVIGCSHLSNPCATCQLALAHLVYRHFRVG